MRRSTLSTKLFAAALPIVLAVATLLALTVRNDLRDVKQAENSAELGRVWEPLINALSAIENEVDASGGALDAIDERAATIDAADGVMGNLGAPEAAALEREAAARYDAASEPMSPSDLAVPRSAADASLDELVVAVERLDGSESATSYVSESRSSLLSARRIVDRALLAPDMLANEADPIDAYDRASRDLVAIGEVLPSEASDPDLGAGLLAVLKLGRARLAAAEVITDIDRWQADPLDGTALATARIAFNELESQLAEFESIAPEEWLLMYRSSGFPSAIAGFRGELNQAAAAVQRGEIGTFDDVAFQELVRQGVDFQTETAQSIVEQAETQVNDVRTSSFRRILITLGAVLLAALLAWFISRSITRRVKAVASGANRVATEQLPALVDALQDPRGKAVLPEIEPVPARGNDEVAELAQAFNSMQSALVDVAQEQVEVLRRGVSDIFVTMARRNRSLIDRQLAMLDEFEAEVEDAEILANYYQLDHLATRMRRNSESLLVLANAEPKRKRVKATEIDDVVRASIGEVEDYRRIEIEALESLQVRGNVVADISHLLAELLDNATSFSPPDSVVRVGGRRTGDSYMLRIVDDGVGIGTTRMRELNELLREPPIVGLSVESTLGMSVVSLLANKHGIHVVLAAGNPGLTVDVLLPSTIFGPIETPDLAPTSTPAIAAAHMPAMADEPIVDWDARTTFNESDEVFVPQDEQPTAPTQAPVVHDRFDDDAPRVTASDWTKMSLDLMAFKSGMTSAAPTAADDDTDDLADDAPHARESIIDQGDQHMVATDDTSSVTGQASGTADAEHELGDDTPSITHQPEPADELVEATFDATPAVTDRADQPELDDELIEATFDATPAVTESLIETTGIEPELDDEPLVAMTDEPEPADDLIASTFDETSGITDDLIASTFDETSSITDDSDLTDDAPEQEATPEPVVADEPAGPNPAEQPAVARRGEFDRPLAPPLTANPLAQRPVVPADAVAAPTPRPTSPEFPGLPTRTPGSGGPDGGPDRLADQAAPSALESALGNAGLPTRERTAEPTMSSAEDPIATTATRLDPDALRQRLRAFQTEFRSGTPGHDADNATANNPNGDLGGDRS